ncbi:hypothetical protein BH11MYX4_BH11MYX4_26280 [soil metagenome]|nr:DUF3025 domain-containing protein [Labilithrix sp.]
MWDSGFTALSPLFWPIADAAGALHGEGFPQPEAIDAALGTRAGVRFERQRPVARRRRGPRDPSSMYDARIKAGCVPTRPGSWHDLMNALVWATFPAAKRALHERQHELVVPAAPGESARRPRELDTLALLDEGGLVVIAPAAFDDEGLLADALGRGEATALVFGHAIYEGLVLGREMPLASVVCVEGDPAADGEALLARADQALALVVADRSRLLDPRGLLRLRPA